MKPIVFASLFVSLFSMVGCSSDIEKAHSYVLASHVKEAEAYCKDFGQLYKINSRWCSGKGCDFYGYTISGECSSHRDGLNVTFIFYRKDEKR